MDGLDPDKVYEDEDVDVEIKLDCDCRPEIFLFFILSFFFFEVPEVKYLRHEELVSLKIRCSAIKFNFYFFFENPRVDVMQK